METDQATKSTSEKEPCEHQPVTDNNLKEPLLLYDQIVAGEVTVAATVCPKHTLPAAIQSEAPSGEPNTTTDQATNSTSEKEPCEHQPVTDNNVQEPLLLYDQIVAGEVTVAATVCPEHRFICRTAHRVVTDVSIYTLCHHSFKYYCIAFINELVNSDICPTTNLWSYVIIALQDTQHSNHIPLAMPTF